MSDVLHSELINENINEETEMVKMLDELLGNASSTSSSDCCCEACQRVDFDRCEDYKEVCISPNMLNCQTRLLRVVVNINNVCRNRLLAISVVLAKAGTDIIISHKGHVFYTGSSSSSCKSVSKEFCFTLPGNLCENPNAINVKVVSNYVLTNPLGSLPCSETPCGC
ncbi:Uncharacterized [Syntrophomonas zehnderi OL-4]|uniref:Uncharacterized n=1 Tax=Syntrophomonas zehnderi OL-4 TaxID=690567 RepID=A0A0E4C8I5_9FIRM|nr:hypothetical protein [Syntrophomonas zehnderi]CFX51311.1 Uncharacterized [Syntrophomonas zehnderi OL-4]